MRDECLPNSTRRSGHTPLICILSISSGLLNNELILSNFHPPCLRERSKAQICAHLLFLLRILCVCCTYLCLYALVYVQVRRHPDSKNKVHSVLTGAQCQLPSQLLPPSLYPCKLLRLPQALAELGTRNLLFICSSIQLRFSAQLLGYFQEAFSDVPLPLRNMSFLCTALSLASQDQQKLPFLGLCCLE